MPESAEQRFRTKPYTETGVRIRRNTQRQVLSLLPGDDELWPALRIDRLETGLDNANREMDGDHVAARQVAGPFEAVSSPERLSTLD